MDYKIMVRQVSARKSPYPYTRAHTSRIKRGCTCRPNLICDSRLHTKVLPDPKFAFWHVRHAPVQSMRRSKLFVQSWEVQNSSRNCLQKQALVPFLLLYTMNPAKSVNTTSDAVFFPVLCFTQKTPSAILFPNGHQNGRLCWKKFSPLVLIDWTTPKKELVWSWLSGYRWQLCRISIDRSDR